jgi:hypothetical protein
MFERFTDDARKTVVRANQHARALRHSYIGTAHLLLALTDDEAGPFAQAMTSLNVSVPELRTHVSASNPSDAEIPTGTIPFTPRCKIALENGCAESVRHHQSTIDIADLGMGLALIDGGAAAHTLAHFGLNPTLLHDQINQHRLPTPSTSTDLTASTSARRRGHRPHDATSLHPDQFAIVSVTFIEDSENQAQVRLPNGSHTRVRYGALASAYDEHQIGSEVFTYAIRVQFVGDQDGQALVRLPDQSHTTLEYTALTVADDPDVKRNPDGSLTLSCPNCDWSHTHEIGLDSSRGAWEAFNAHHAEQHPERFL